MENVFDLQQMIEEGKIYLNRAIPEVSKLSDEFYKEIKESTWDRLGQLLEGLAWFLVLTDQINTNNEKKIGNIENAIIDNINLLGEAVENQDTVLLGDYLQYETIPLLEEIYRKLNGLDEVEGN